MHLSPKAAEAKVLPRLRSNHLDLFEIILSQSSYLGQYLFLSFALFLRQVEANRRGKEGDGKGFVPFGCKDCVWLFLIQYVVGREGGRGRERVMYLESVPRRTLWLDTVCLWGRIDGMDVRVDVCLKPRVYVLIMTTRLDMQRRY